MLKIDIFVGTVYGNAELTANKIKQALMQKGYTVNIIENNIMEYYQFNVKKIILIITSTTGHGDLPDNIIPLFQQIKSVTDYQSNLIYGLIALGDSRHEIFCGAAFAFDLLLQERNAIRIGEICTIDAKKYSDPILPACDWIHQWCTLL